MAYHPALHLHGFAHSVCEEHVCLSEHNPVCPLRFASVFYRTVRPPTALPEADRMSLGVETLDRQGLPVRATGPESTLADVLDRPALAGRWEEVWRSWEGVAVALDFPFLLRYARLLGSATTAAKLGYVLEAGRERLAVLDELRLLAPPPAPPRRAGTAPRHQPGAPLEPARPGSLSGRARYGKGMEPGRGLDRRGKSAQGRRSHGIGGGFTGTEGIDRGGTDMRLSCESLQRDAATTGFRPEVLEKVFLLLDLLEAINGHPDLAGKLALKGGTALNLFLFGAPRLSVDIDLNYITTQNYVGAEDRDIMRADRQLVEQAVELTPQTPKREEHAGRS